MRKTNETTGTNDPKETDLIVRRINEDRTVRIPEELLKDLGVKVDDLVQMEVLYISENEGDEDSDYTPHLVMYKIDETEE